LGVIFIELLVLVLLVAAMMMWVIVLLLPWRPWTARPFLDAPHSDQGQMLEDVTVLIPARNESGVIRDTLRALNSQGTDLYVVVVDDQSDDGTAELALTGFKGKLRVISGTPLPNGWSGKLWALEQGRQHIDTPITLLIDADIKLQPGIINAAIRKMRHERVQFLSLMAVPHMHIFWERLLMPAFVYFFKLLYPFRLSNSRFPLVAAAAGGFVLLETRLFEALGGFRTLKGALIDDCTLARRLKAKGFRTWMGLTHSVHSLRRYRGLREIWDMVARTAFTQLKYSYVYLLICTVLMVIGFVIPVIGLFWYPWGGWNLVSLVIVIMMMTTYSSSLRFYGMSTFWALTMPLIGVLFLAMTWSSAYRYWNGQRAQWRGRSYSRRST
jgi:hopene-associated glycosyltransferase HpnB